MSELSLALFTVLAQTAVGLVLASSIQDITAPAPIWQTMAALALILAALGAAMAHLGSPRNCLNVVRNLKKSWLSREIVLVNALAAGLALTLLARLGWLPWNPAVINAATALIGLAAVYAMSRVYRLTVAPPWNAPAWTIDFYGTALLVGGAAATWSAPSGAFLALAGLVLKLIVLGPILQAAGRRDNYGEAALDDWLGRLEEQFTLRWLLLIAGATGLACALAVDNSWSAGVMIVSAALVLAAGELIGRMLFYEAHRRVGL